MNTDLTVKIGGEAGQGIQTVGDLLTLVCHQAGFHVMAINDFESRIRGGHSFTQIRISDRPIFAPHHVVDLLIALDQKTYGLHKHELAPDGLVIMNSKETSKDKKVIHLPITDLSMKAGGKITSNSVAAGAGLGLMEVAFESLSHILKKKFQSKSKDVVEMNLSAAKFGYDSVKDISLKTTLKWNRRKPKGALIDGSKAFALGALAGDCRFASFYPMSPATGIMAQLSLLADDFPLVVEQAEDELSAINMIIGSSFAGVRSITATSGGGFCLMTEGLGLAGITETPVVIINAQRPGPATGLPTRTAQGDLLFTIRAAQDEFPRFVFAPGTPFEAFQITARAFKLSEKYQAPVILLTDQFLNDSLFISEKPFRAPKSIPRFTVEDKDIKAPEQYNRFKLTKSGVSPRALPCNGEALVVVTGNEHSEDGHISEEIKDRVNMARKRRSKVKNMIKEMKPPQLLYEKSKTLLVCWGSTKGAVMEAVEVLRSRKMDVGCLIFSDIWPFPSDHVISALEKCKKFVMVELNQTAQLGQLIREQTGLSYSDAILKFDGRPIYPNDIVERVIQFI
ncbi:MAG: 2-oxoacid:acceptor oxidoreductase subunit alpha [Deltaproteobacteria bacterium]|nr:2-oxoacid:acceptor oxidoreductase subunit alpha [Deltaproteobacteria bacterium]